MSLKNPRDRMRSRTSFETREASGSLPGHHSKALRRRRIIGPVLVVCALVAALAALDYWANSGKIFDGVAVGGVPVGGQTPAEAGRMIDERGGEALQEIRFTGGPKSSP